MTDHPDAHPGLHRQTSFGRLAAGAHEDPFAVLGPHLVDGTRWITGFVPGATRVSARGPRGAAELREVPDHPGIFTGPLEGDDPYRLEAESADGTRWSFDDPYRFGPLLTDMDAYLFAEGTHRRVWEALGAHPMTREGVEGTQFAVWAPHARRVSVVGPFNLWDGRRNPMRRRDGLWEIFLPGVGAGAPYKFEILGPDGRVGPLKADPVGFGSEHPPENASVVRDIRGHDWADDAWMETRAGRNAATAPISIYEVHLGSWRRRADGRRLTYAEAADELIAYVGDMGFTHLEILPISEHPFDGSWGYQPVGLYAPTVRHGAPQEFRALVEAAHRAGLGVILDWVPGHFPTDEHGLSRFDGEAVYEYADPKEGFHQDWNTLIYDYGRREVRSFLTANALYWLEEYHVDGLRVDAVASMLYRDFSREPGEWVPNRDGGRENYEAIDFLREVNAAARQTQPGTMTVAEESTAFPKVTAPADQGGLGFGFKWNMGWMFDSLDYVARDPAGRRAHHHKLTFGLTYAFDETFVLSISHDEVVHGKGSMLGRMPGTGAERFANLRAYYGFMWGHPGKKLLFMGQEFGQEAEWDHDAQLDWDALDKPAHAGIGRLVRDLNTLYRAEPALHVKDADPDGFQWIEADDTANSVYAWIRRGGPQDPPVVVLCNFGPDAHPAYRVGLPAEGRWREALNTDADIYGGAGRGNVGAVEAAPVSSHGQPASTDIMLPPLSAVFLVYGP